MRPENDGPAAAGGDDPAAGPHGRAALLLVESLIHGLCERALLPVGAAVAIVDRAADVQFDQAEAADGAAASMWRAHDLLTLIAASLRIDGDDEASAAGISPP